MGTTTIANAEGIKQALQDAMKGGLVTDQDFKRLAFASTDQSTTQNIPFADGYKAKGNIIT